MGAATVNEYRDTSGACVYAGTWTAETGIAATPYGTDHITNTAGASVTVSFTGRALYMLCWSKAGSYGAYTVSIDGASVPGVFNNFRSVGQYNLLVPLARGLADGPHTAVITNLASSGHAYLRPVAFYAPTGPKGTPTPGNVVAMGDSVTLGYGAMDLDPVSLIAEELQARLGRPMAVFNQGVTGDTWGGTSGGAGAFGGMYRTFSQVLPNTPEFLTYLFGSNDFATNSNGGNCGVQEWKDALIGVLSFLEDTIVPNPQNPADPSNPKVAIGTPCYPPAFLTYFNANANLGYGTKLAGLEAAAVATHGVVGLFPWAKVASIFEVLDYNELLFQSGGTNVHPNDDGYAAIAAEFARALLGAAA